MFKTFIILKYFHIQTSAIKRKYPTLIVRIFLVSARTHSISRYIHIQTLCVHKRNVLRFLQHGTYHVVVRGGSHFCQSPKGGGSGVFFIKTQGRANTFLGKKYQNSPALPPPPPRKNVKLKYIVTRCGNKRNQGRSCLCAKYASAYQNFPPLIWFLYFMVYNTEEKEIKNSYR